MSIRHDRDLRYQKSRNRKKRPKTFRTQEAAEEYAKKAGLKDYEIINLKPETSSSKKLRVVKK